METTENSREIPAAASAESRQRPRRQYTTPLLKNFGSCKEITRGAVNVGADAGIYS